MTKKLIKWALFIAAFLIILPVIILEVYYESTEGFRSGKYETGKIKVKVKTDQEIYVKENHLDLKEFLKLACQSKTVCKKYSEIRLSCAEAGSVDKCIAIKMNGDYFGNCTNDGKIAGIDDKIVPTYFQCIGI